MKFKTEQEILLEMIAKAQEQNLLSETDDIVERVEKGELTDNQYVLDLATHAYINRTFVEMAEDIFLGMDIATARGEQLDKIGNIVNVHRFPGIAAQINLELSLDLPEPNDIIIPAGTVVEIDQLQVDPYITYTTDEQVTIAAGVTTATVTASSDRQALQRRVPAETTYGLQGFPLVAVYNREAGTTGRNIEEDTDYRQRILLWPVINTVGTKASFEDYLGEVQGLDDYKLIPRPNGQIGYLIVVCDCNESRLPEIQAGIQDNCMLFTDDPCYCINPARTTLNVELSFEITREPIQHTVSEIIELIRQEVTIWIDGGTSRNGNVLHGLRIGETFTPSQLVMHLHNTFPELISVSVETEETSIPDENKFQSGTVEVTII